MNTMESILKERFRSCEHQFADYLLLMVLILFPTGCTSVTDRDASNNFHDPSTQTAGHPEVTPLAFVQGTVRMVNKELKFLVFDFALDRFPSTGQFLEVHRGNEKIGEIRVTGPTKLTYTAADILSGDIRAGDTVKAK